MTRQAISMRRCNIADLERLTWLRRALARRRAGYPGLTIIEGWVMGA